MKISRLSALFAAALIAVSTMAGCSSDKEESSRNASSSGYSHGIESYKENPDIGKEKIEISINEDANHNESNFKLNQVIDSGKISPTGEKYIYLDVTIKNTMAESYEINALNNFYLVLSDETEIFTDIRTDLYAKQYMNGYEQLLEIPANGEFHGYIGFAIDPSVTDFTACYFATANENDKGTVIRCPVTQADIVPAPEGLFKPEA